MVQFDNPSHDQTLTFSWNVYIPGHDLSQCSAYADGGDKFLILIFANFLDESAVKYIYVVYRDM